jgi:putative phosphoesterase
MRIAVLADIHANLVALEAVLAVIAEEKVDRVVCLGDLATLGPAPNRVLDRLRREEWVFVRGNHDHYLWAPDLLARHTDEEIVHRSVAWCRARITRENLDFVRSLPPAPVNRHWGGRTLVFCHGSPRSDIDDILPDTEPGKLAAMMSDGSGTCLVACGHTHVQTVRYLGATLVVNAGSVGIPFVAFVQGAPPRVKAAAEFALLTVTPEGVSAVLRQLPLDPGALRAAALRSDDPVCAELARQYDALAAAVA